MLVYKVRTTLAAIEQQSDPQNFVRVHRSYIVNIEAVKESQPWFRGDQRILINDGTILNLSRRYRDQFGKFDGAFGQGFLTN